MDMNELVTKADLLELENRIVTLISKLDTRKRGLMNPEEAGMYIGGASVQTMYQKAASGEIASHKACGLKFSQDDLDCYIRSTRRRSNMEIQNMSKLR